MPGLLFGNHLQSHWSRTEQNHHLLPTGHSLQVCGSWFLLLFFPNFCPLNALSPSSVSSLFSTQAAGTAWTAILGLVLASKGRCWERGLWGRSSWRLRKWAGGCFRGSNSYAGCKGIVYSWVVHSWIMVRWNHSKSKSCEFRKIYRELHTNALCSHYYLCFKGNSKLFRARQSLITKVSWMLKCS